MNYKDYLSELEELQTGKKRLMYWSLKSLLVDMGKESDKEEFKVELRKFYKIVISLPNPIDMKDGSIVNQKSLDIINDLLIKIIDLLNDYYGNFKFYTK